MKPLPGPLELAELRVQRARRDLEQVRGGRTERAAAERLKVAEDALEQMRNPPPPQPSPPEPVCWCGARLVRIKGRAVCADGTHDD